MSQKQNKPLVIKVASRSVPNGTEGKWNDISGSMETFTKDIIVPEFDIDGGKISQIVSGMPSVFSRANLFKLSLEYITDVNEKGEGLLKFYESLIDEWKGLIACIALDSKNISVEPITLSYSDGNDIGTTANIYEPKGAFGNMLFDRKALWMLQGESDNSKNYPFINVISYKGEVIGATSPESIVFTSVKYNLSEDRPWLNVKNNRLCDPLKSNITPDELKELYGYVTFLAGNVNSFSNYYSNLPVKLQPNSSSLNGAFSRWKKSIEDIATGKGIDLENVGVPSIGLFEEPFNKLFNKSDNLYGVEGKITDDGQSEGVIPFKSKELLLPKTSEIVCFNFGNKAAQNPDFLKNQPVHVLRADTAGMPGVYHYFALPLSIKGLDIFGDTIDQLLMNNAGSNNSISALYDPGKLKGNLEISLRLSTAEGKQLAPIEEVYTVSKNKVVGEDILIWPDFISKQWGRYFMYSEVPHNQPSIAATPFVMDMEDAYYRSLMDKNGNPVYISDNGSIVIPDELNSRIEARLHVVSDNRVAGNQYQYEIYESSVPFKGLRFESNGKDSGFVLIRYSVEERTNIPRNSLNNHTSLVEANLGIDFGSTNTTIAYLSQQTNNESLINFNNRRVSLFRDDNIDNNIHVASENEIFFFQNDEIRSNEIKSILTIHDELRLPRFGSDVNRQDILNQAVVGGFPNFEKNLPINSASDNRYTLTYPRSGSAEVVHNMKWSEDPIEQSHKGAFISSLLLQVYAELFQSGHIPARMKWSLPSAMGNRIIGKYNKLWSDIVRVNPIVENHGRIDLVVAKMPTSISEIADWNTENNPNQGSSWGSNASSAGSNGNGWNTNSANTSGNAGWGGQSNPSSGASSWGNDSKKVDLRSSTSNIEIPSGPKTFAFEAIDASSSLTESTAVANYWVNNNQVKPSQNDLLLSFDVGGSTTDISALTSYDNNNLLVKQHSIRFAAQRISQATRYSKNFESVLLTACQKHDIKIQGLNVEPKKYSAETSAYYFEQIVDRLNGNQLKEFYTLLSADCPELMSVNLYVTGLIAFYSGQLATNMINEIRTATDLPLGSNWTPNVIVVFAGKGARIFEWFGSVTEDEADKYYLDLFIKGMGGMQVAQELLRDKPAFNPRKARAQDGDIKCEVAKGLALPTQKILVPAGNVTTEILGEEGFIFSGANGEDIRLGSDAVITPQMMERIGGQFRFSPDGPPCPRFTEFAQIFQGYASQFFGFKMTPQEFMSALGNMNIDAYIANMPEYREAQKGKEDEFDFVAPIIILEAMKFYDEHLIKSISS
jgi:hypothetical protein